jgi:hypothetical protein
MPDQQIIGSVTYSSGLVVPASTAVTIIEPPVTPTLFGVNPPSPAYTSGSLAAELDVNYPAAYGHPLAVLRSYRGPGDWSMAESWATSADAIAGSWRDRASVHSQKPPVAQAATGALNTWLASYVRSIPATGRPRVLVFWHEPEDNVKAGEFTAAQFAAMYTQFGHVIRDLARPDVQLWPMFMAWSLNPAAGRDLTAYLPADLTLIHGIGWDVYPFLGADFGTWHEFDSYPWWLAAVALTRQLGLPIGVGETSCRTDPTDPQHRAAWLTRLAAATQAAGARWVCYFDRGQSRLRVAQDQTGKLLASPDQPTITAWSTLSRLT